MATEIFVNLPVKDLNKSKEFFGKLGYTFNAQFTDEKAACMVISEDIYAMLLTEPFFNIHQQGYYRYFKINRNADLPLGG